MRDLQDIRELINPEGITDGKIVAAQARFYDYCKMMNPKFYRDDRPYQRDLCETLQAIFEGRLINKSTRRAVQESDDQPTAAARQVLHPDAVRAVVHGQEERHARHFSVI